MTKHLAEATKKEGFILAYSLRELHQSGVVMAAGMGSGRPQAPSVREQRVLKVGAQLAFSVIVSLVVALFCFQCWAPA